MLQSLPPKSVVVVVPGPSVSGLSGLPVLFYQRTNHLLCCVNQAAESRLHDEVDETCNQTERRADGMDRGQKGRWEDERI